MQNTNRMKDMPVWERPYEKFQKYGSQNLTDAELLAIIMRTGTRGERSLDLASRVLTLSGEDRGLLGIHHCTLEQLMAIRGIGRVKAMQLKCIGELARRFSKQQAAVGLSFKEPSAVASYYMEDLRHMEKEVCVALMLDTKCRLRKEVHISTGTVNASLVSPREIFAEALSCNAVNFILMHNHPSGDPHPSREDEIITQRVFECGQLMGIPLLDHIIIGDNCYVSFKESGLVI